MAFICPWQNVVNVEPAKLSDDRRLDIRRYNYVLQAVVGAIPDLSVKPNPLEIISDRISLTAVQPLNKRTLQITCTGIGHSLYLNFGISTMWPESLAGWSEIISQYLLHNLCFLIHAFQTKVKLYFRFV